MDDPSPPHVTVAIPVKDRRERMLRCLDAVLALDYPAYDVLVLDNESSDGTAEACRERAGGAAVPIRVESMAGTVGHLRNRAADLAGGEILAFTDSDCMPAPGWLRDGVGPFRDPAVGIVQGKTLPEPGVERTRWDATLEVTEYSGRFESCNLLIRRDALRRSDGFDEVVGHFWEDTAAGWAILREGWRPAFARDAVVYHDVTQAGLRWWLRRGLRYGNVASAVRRYPELRKEYLFARYFLRARDAKLAAALVGLVLAPRDRRALLLAAPYAWTKRPRGLHPRDLTLGVVESVLFDLSILTGMVRGSIRHRTLVL
jgi:cellulose synthase/poly-beta-1,6-N-acetylglucosamine synthase-like glycosyltransferase